MKKSLKDELKGLSEAELEARVDGMRRELFSTRLNAATRPIKDNAHFKKRRREIACVLTLLREKRTAA